MHPRERADARFAVDVDADGAVLGRSHGDTERDGAVHTIIDGDRKTPRTGTLSNLQPSAVEFTKFAPEINTEY